MGRIKLHVPGLVLFLAATLLLFGSPNQAEARLSLIEGTLFAEELLRETGASSLSVAVLDHGKILWQKQFGVADFSSNMPPSATTMYGIGSVSKMIATAAIMSLVDKGLLDIDKPITTYLPDFSMRSPEYARITTRMLLNHSSGLPGSNARSVETFEPFATYADLLLEDLKILRLKHAPGFLNVYCNDGFTLLEKIVAAVSGTSYATYVQEQIFSPLGMMHSRVPLERFPVGSFAQLSQDGRVQPQEFVNTYGSGGIYSTPTDMCRLLSLFLRDRLPGSEAMLSRASVEAMAQDQTAGTFRPVESDLVRYGLGWDTVSQPGLAAVGVRAWMKGGDTDTYHASVFALPDEHLGVAVLCAGMNSGMAEMLSERILLAELTDRERIAAIPKPLPTLIPAEEAPPADLAVFSGYFATNDTLYRAQPRADGALDILTRNDNEWKPLLTNLRFRADGWFTGEAKPTFSISFLSAEGRRYMLARIAGGLGHYLETLVMAQQILPKNELSPAWENRLGQRWLLVNESPHSSLWQQENNPLLHLEEIPDLGGLLFVHPAGSAPNQRYVVDPSASDALASMMLLIPMIGARDMNDLDVELRNGREWMRFGSWLYRPEIGLPTLAPSGTLETRIGPEGFGEWFRIPAGKEKTLSVDIPASGRWILCDADGTLSADGWGATSLPLDASSTDRLLTILGVPEMRMKLTSTPQQ